MSAEWLLSSQVAGADTTAL